MNSMGARFNPVSITIVNLECHEAYEAAFTATKKGLYAVFNLVNECGVDGCSLCQFTKRHDIRDRWIRRPLFLLILAEASALYQSCSVPIQVPAVCHCTLICAGKVHHAEIIHFDLPLQITFCDYQIIESKRNPTRKLAFNSASNNIIID
jgi:hypothetical protein